MKKQTSFLTLVFTLALLSMPFDTYSWAQETNFQSDTQNEVVETTETKNGKQIRRVRSGKVREREGEAQVGTIEDSEVKKYQKRHESLSLSAIGIGPFGSSNLGRDKLLYGFSYGHIWEPSDLWDIRIDVMGIANSSGSFWSLGFGPSYIFSPSSMSPFIGVQGGFAFADGDADNDGGFYAQANLGLKMFRLSDKQMEIVATYAGLFTEEDLSVYGLQFRILF